MERLATFSYSDNSTPIRAETANAWTHGLGWGLSVIGAVALMWTVVPGGDALKTLGCAIYAGSLVALFAASTLSHSTDHPQRKNLFRMLDQICIFLLIAGSYTPFFLSHLRSGPWWMLLAAMWLLTVIGIMARIRLGERAVPFFWFLLLACLPAAILGQVLTITGLPGLTYVTVGGLAYLSGLWFFVNDRKHPYFHAIWHCCVILGSGLHFLFHYQYVAL